METLDSPILLSRLKLREVCSGLCRFVVSGILSNLCSFLRVLYLPRGDSVTGFKSPDIERYTALFASSISFPDREETHTWSGNNNFFLVAECMCGCYVLHNA